MTGIQMARRTARIYVMIMVIVKCTQNRLCTANLFTYSVIIMTKWDSATPKPPIKNEKAPDKHIFDTLDFY